MAEFMLGLLIGVILSVAVFIALVAYESNRTSKELQDLFKKLNEYNKYNKEK